MIESRKESKIERLEGERERERERRKGRKRQNATDGGKQVGEKDRGSLGGPLLIAAGRGYVPRVIAAGVCEGPAGTPELQPPRTLSRPPSSRHGAVERGTYNRIRALDPRAFVPRNRRMNSEPVCRPGM